VKPPKPGDSLGLFNDHTAFKGSFPCFNQPPRITQMTNIEITTAEEVLVETAEQGVELSIFELDMVGGGGGVCVVV
jgi:hypothetical protein